ncbi:MAG: hypothetical protein EKK46_11375 [Rhodocyclaceae bacterium]|nr:MAG: hypothetical protein EKK46_11375 [Rhodocyclaceae bacterium]
MTMIQTFRFNFRACCRGAAVTLLAAVVAACGSAPERKGYPVDDDIPVADNTDGNTKGAGNAPTRPRNESRMRDIAKYMAGVAQEQNVFFALGSAVLTDESLQKIQKLTDKLLENRDLTVTLVGYTENFGSDEYAVAVADQRINAVAREILKRGVRMLQVRKLTRAYDADLVRYCEAAACGKLLRRVEMQLNDKGES